MNLNTIKLKIKSKYLADEARINRKEANKLSGRDKHSLNHHRKTKLRDEARATHLAYGYLRGIPYAAMEQKVNDVYYFLYYIQPKLRKMIETYGDKDMPTMEEWLKGANVIVKHEAPESAPITYAQLQECYVA